MKYRDDIKYFCVNGDLREIISFPVDLAGESDLAYEVIRVNNYSPLFVDDHLQRLNNTLSLKKWSQISLSPVRTAIMELIKANKVFEGNLKLVVSFESGRATSYLYFIPHRYPSMNQQDNGVKAYLQFACRELPQAKVSNWVVRGEANRIIDNKGVYETLLVNEAGEITEGSRSNVFFIKEDKLYTAEDEKVLSGITRQKVLKLAKEKQIGVVYQAVPISETEQFEACFITGTSPGILQLWSINDVCFTVGHPIYELLLEAFDELVDMGSLG